MSAPGARPDRRPRTAGESGSGVRTIVRRRLVEQVRAAEVDVHEVGKPDAMRGVGEVAERSAWSGPRVAYGPMAVPLLIGSAHRGPQRAFRRGQCSASAGGAVDIARARHTPQRPRGFRVPAAPAEERRSRGRAPADDEPRRGPAAGVAVRRTRVIGSRPVRVVPERGAGRGLPPPRLPDVLVLPNAASAGRISAVNRGANCTSLGQGAEPCPHASSSAGSTWHETTA